ncbi:MAG TPA: thioredoxin family protein [Thermoanaerobaculia bacterium]|nr:thioredoxin family protein [Thermoanaerobaculia bacterium]
MPTSRQRRVPILLFIIAVALIGARVVHHFAKSKEGVAAKGDLVQWKTPAEGLRLARESGKPLLLDFTAEWCQPCHLLDAQVFRVPVVARSINERFIAVRVVDRRHEEGSNPPLVGSLQEKYGVRGFPTVVFADAGGAERARTEGFRGREQFEQVMESAR